MITYIQIIMANHTYVFDHDLTIHIMHIYIIVHNELFLFLNLSIYRDAIYVCKTMPLTLW